MEIDEKKLEKILTKQLHEYEKKLKHHSQDTDAKIKHLTEESDERMQRYIGIIQEDNDDKFKAIMEYVQDIPAIKEKQDLMFDKMGELTEDATMVKETVQEHEVRIQKLEVR